MNSLPVKTSMDRISKSEDELLLLRALCDEAASRVRRLELLQSLDGHVFMDPENQVVFESICFLFPRGGISAARLTVHLNNRGFPDISMEKYFPAAPANVALRENTDKENT